MHSTSYLKDLLRPVIPGFLLRTRQSWRNQRRVEYTAQLWEATQGLVIAGPFAGMRYVNGCVCGPIGSKLLGCYEQELHAVVEEIIQSSFDLIVDVGAAEGYYAVGFLTRIQMARGIAFESEPSGRELVRSMADSNGVADRLTISGKCEHADLTAALQNPGKVLVVMDAEGAEDALLDPGFCPALVDVTILVEVHEHLCPGVAARLLSRFGATHSVQRILTSGDVDLPAVAGFSQSQLHLLADEMRSFRMEWLYLKPNTPGPEHQ